MKPRIYPTSAPLGLAALATLFVLTAPSILAQVTAKKSNPTSKLYVADLTGQSQIDNGEKIQPLAKDEVRAPEGSVIETKANSTDSLVLSNGTAIYVSPETRFEVKRFLQEPFTPNRNDLDVEPSVSQMMVQITRGGLGLCTSKLVAGSTMTYKTPQATIAIRGRRLMIETTENETRVSLLEGDITVSGDNSVGGEVLHGGQRAIVHRTTPGGPAVVTVEAIPESENSKLDHLVSLACISRRTVFFESVQPANGTSELVAVRATPAAPATAFTVSPSRINP